MEIIGSSSVDSDHCNYTWRCNEKRPEHGSSFIRAFIDKAIPTKIASEAIGIDTDVREY